MTPKASVMVPACNMPRLPSKAIAALPAQSVPKEDFDIILEHDKGEKATQLCKNAARKKSSPSSFGRGTESSTKNMDTGICKAAP